ncbi:hypothetical protein Xsto_03848 [Xenorhabdus stockiae]|uniref:Uncharacterized protein n=1 Tax=Xenorhabdus stockiae TaxID=351614 RepID=A0A2D0KB50_9GAMM|nr:hypothetical protein [Xenorhabdus stockiae]PHM60592.1 hypothetical protein Xsto_03848 [Xenorhabdus stockiae]
MSLLNSKTITIESGRDAGKTFVITEMPIVKADDWAMRALFTIANGGVDIQLVNILINITLIKVIVSGWNY